MDIQVSKCRYCGKENAATDKFCETCGIPLFVPPKQIAANQPLVPISISDVTSPAITQSVGVSGSSESSTTATQHNSTSNYRTAYAAIGVAIVGATLVGFMVGYSRGSLDGFLLMALSILAGLFFLACWRVFDSYRCPNCGNLRESYIALAFLPIILTVAGLASFPCIGGWTVVLLIDVIINPLARCESITCRKCKTEFYSMTQEQRLRQRTRDMYGARLPPDYFEKQRTKLMKGAERHMREMRK